MPSTQVECLAVVISSRFAGILARDDDGRYSFAYDSDYRGPDLSVAARRIDGMSYGHAVVEPIIEGWLPDGKRVRDAISRKFDFVPNVAEVADILRRTVGANCRAMAKNLDRNHGNTSFVYPDLDSIYSGTLPWDRQAAVETVPPRNCADRRRIDNPLPPNRSAAR